MDIKNSVWIGMDEMLILKPNTLAMYQLRDFNNSVDSGEVAFAARHVYVFLGRGEIKLRIPKERLSVVGMNVPFLIRGWRLLFLLNGR